MSNADFERCADFLARMIEKYGNELDLPKAVDKYDTDEIHYDTGSTTQKMQKQRKREHSCLTAI